MIEAVSLSTPRMIPSRDIADDEWVTQYGRGEDGGFGTFRNSPRYPRESEISMIWGRIGVDEAAMIVTGRARSPLCRVRQCLAGDLRRRGFKVVHTPTPRNPMHVSVYLPGTDGQWDNDEADRFDEAFVRGGES